MKTRSWWRSSSGGETGERNPGLSGRFDGYWLQRGGIFSHAGERVTPTFGLLAALFLVGLTVPFLTSAAMAAGIGDLSSSSACDLSVMVERVADTIIAGESFSYTVAVRNSGPDGASGVHVTIALDAPEGVDLSSSTVSRGGYDQKTGVWKVGEIPAGTVERLTLHFSTSPSIPPGRTVSSAARVVGDGIDPDPENNEDGSWAAITTDAEVVAAVTCPSPGEGAGDLPLYIVEITNHGPSIARNVWFRDLMPPAIWLRSARYVDGDGGAGGEWIGFLDLGDLAPNETRTISIFGHPYPTPAPSAPAATVTVRWVDASDPACNSDVSSCRIDRLS